jgi:hypothetical protein
MLPSSGCGFVARTHAGNLQHVRAMFREAISCPGFAFLHVLAGCVTCQEQSYAREVHERCDLLPPDYDPSEFARAIEAARGERFMPGVLYRRDGDREGGGTAAAGGTPAPRVPVRTSVESYPLERANDALARLREGKMRGAAVLLPERRPKVRFPYPGRLSP